MGFFKKSDIMKEKNSNILEKQPCFYEKADKNYKHEDVKKEDGQ